MITDFPIYSGYRSSGSVDPNVCTNLKAAYTAGFKTRDVYIFPCENPFDPYLSIIVFLMELCLLPGPTCSKSAATQMSELVTYLNSNCKSQWSGRVWLDIEGSQYWLGSTSSNQAWYKVRESGALL